MLDLHPIKARLAAATQLPNPPYVHLAVAKKADVQLVDNCQADLKALVAEVERLRAENDSLRKELSDTEKELDDLYRTNPFYKGKPDA